MSDVGAKWVGLRTSSIKLETRTIGCYAGYGGIGHAVLSEVCDGSVSGAFHDCNH